jgi:uncharacterized phage protein gp47/JayE
VIDPGHEFSVPYEALIQSLEDRVRNGVEQSELYHFMFQSAITAYELPREATEITSVTGLRGKVFTVFQPGADYQFANNRLLWPDPAHRPDDGSGVDVEFTWRDRPAGLTDFNPGSVIGTLIRAVAREFKVLYEQMDQAYRRAFIDVATGVALDNVVALLGVERHPAIKARGQVTYLRRTATDQPVVIAAGERVADATGRTYVTLQSATIEPQQDEFHVQSGGVLSTADKIAKLVGIWPRDDTPDPATTLATVDTAAGQPFGADERTITLAPAVRPSADLRVRFQAKSVTVPVEAVQPGPDGNVNAGTVTVMPTPPVGVTGVLNEALIDGGRPAEPDDQLRERAKHALERAGNATLNALKFAVLGVDGVDGVDVLDHSVDGSIPLGEVRLRYSAAGDLDQASQAVGAVVDATRAAGIHAVAELIQTVLVSGTFYLVPDTAVPAGASQAFLTAVITAIRALTIGAPLSVRRLNALAFQVGGLADVAEAQLGADGHPVPDPLVVDSAKLIRPDEANLHAVLLRGFEVVATRKAGTANQVDLRVADATGTAVVFTGYSVDLSVELRATLKMTPDQPSERVGNFTRRVTFATSSTATLEIQAGDAPGFRPADHDPAVTAVIAAAAYPALAAAQTTIDLSP